MNGCPGGVKAISSSLSLSFNLSFCRSLSHSLSLSCSLSRLLIDGVKEPLCELPELSCCRLALLLQSHVILPQVLHLLLQHRLILFLLSTEKHTRTHIISTETRSKKKKRNNNKWLQKRLIKAPAITRTSVFRQ